MGPLLGAQRLMRKLRGDVTAAECEAEWTNESCQEPKKPKKPNSEYVLRCVSSYMKHAPVFDHSPEKFGARHPADWTTMILHEGAWKRCLACRGSTQNDPVQATSVETNGSERVCTACLTVTSDFSRKMLNNAKRQRTPALVCTKCA